MAYLRRAPRYENVTEAFWFMMDVNDPVSDCHWKAYIQWCKERSLDPISGDRSTPLSFVADKAEKLRKEGKMPTSALPYKITINNIWKVYGLPDFSREKVTTDLVKSIRRQTPQRAKYDRIFFAGDILDSCLAMGDVTALGFTEAHRKVAALVAICGACRKDDICNIKTKDITWGANGNAFLPYEGKTKATRGVTQIIIPHVKKLGIESPAQVVRAFLGRNDWNEHTERPGFILVKDKRSCRSAHKDTIGRYLDDVFKNSRAYVVAPPEFKFGPHAYKHSAVSSFKLCGMSREHMGRYCRTSEGTLEKWYDHADRMFESPTASKYAGQILKKIVSTFTELNPLNRRRSTRG